MSEVTRSSSPCEINKEESDLKKTNNLNHQLRKINHELNSNISISLLNLITSNKLKKNYKEILKKQKSMLFSLKQLPKISVGDFIYRIVYYAKIEDATLISGLIYLDRFCKKKKIILTEYNIHRLLFISILVAIKFLEDKYFTNIFYSKICGIKIEILNKMEYEFVCGLNFEMYIEKDFFYKYQDLLLNSQE
jgi:hypothetical protein